MNVRRISVIVLVVVGLVAASSVGASAATVSPEKWAPKFCTALSSWQQTIGDKGNALESALSTTTATSTDTAAVLKEARGKIAAFLAEMVKATDHAAAGIKKAGTPSSPNGAKISAVFVNGFTAISKEFAKAEGEAKKLPTASADAFKRQGQALGQKISGSADTLGKGFSSVEKLDKGKKLQTAVMAAPACAFLSSESSSSEKSSSSS